jgi:hypothetical protein
MDLTRQKALLMLWLMLTTNNDIFGQPGGTTDTALAALTTITGIDDIKPKLVTVAMGAKYQDDFGAIRNLYQAFSQGLAWPGAVPPGLKDHPTLDDLQTNFFK